MFDQLSVGDLVSIASEHPHLAADEEIGIVERLRAGDPDALEELVRGNLRIAIDEAIRTRGLGPSQLQLVRAGVRTLVEAAQSYDPAQDGSFAEHARLRVRRTMIESVSVS